MAAGVTARRLLGTAITVLLVIGMTILSTSPASADATTCISAPRGMMCTTVVGDHSYVEGALSKHILVPDPTNSTICNMAAWFFYVPPAGGAYDLGYTKHGGCIYGSGTLAIRIDRQFEPGTLICSKWYEEDFTKFIGEKCVGLSP